MITPSEILTWIINEEYEGDLRLYIFTVDSRASEDLAGVPARITHSNEKTGEYRMQFLDGSSLEVIAETIRILD